MKQFLLLFAAAATLFAADATGRWTGNLIVPADGGEQTRPAHLVLKQEGTVLTGTGGPSEDKQDPIENGKVENGIITFQIPDHDKTMRFVLKQQGDQIVGDVTREHEGQTQRARINVKRVP